MSSRRALLALAPWLAAACADPGGATLTGRALLEGEDDHAGIVVSAAGAEHAGTVTSADGRFVLRGLKAGTYSVVLAARDSVEGTQALAAELTVDGAVLEDVVFHPTGRVVGQVVDAATRLPLEGALVVSTGGRGGALTDRKGAFTLPGVATGGATVAFSFTGLAPQQKQVKVVRGQAVDVGAVALGPPSPDKGPAAVGGQVVFPDGTPAAAAQVRIVSPFVDRGTVTDSQGRFRFDAVAGGAVSLTATADGYEITLPTVLAIEGSSGLVVADGLFPLAQNPVELTFGRRLTELTQWTLTPDQQTLLGAAAESTVGVAVVAIPLDGGARSTVVGAAELGTSSPRIAGIASDSTTIAVSAHGRNSSWLGQVFLTSTVSTGRQLFTNQGCVRDATPAELVVLDGANCERGVGQLWRHPLRFGSAPEFLGDVELPFVDARHGRVFDVVSRDGGVSDVDVIAFGTNGARTRVLDGVFRLDGVSADGRYIAWSSAYEPGPSWAELGVLDLSTGAKTVLAAHAPVSSTIFSSDGHALALSNGSLRAVELATGTVTTVADHVSSWGVSPAGRATAIFRTVSWGDPLGSLSWVPQWGASEAKLGDDVSWWGWSGDGQWLYFIDQIQLGDETGRLRRVALSGGPPVELDPRASSSPNHAPRAAPVGGALAYTRREVEVLSIVVNTAPGNASVVLGELAVVEPWTWTFSKDGRYLAWNGAAGAPRATNVQAIDGSGRRPIAREGYVTWLDDGSALIMRWQVSGFAQRGTWHATFR